MRSPVASSSLNVPSLSTRISPDVPRSPDTFHVRDSTAMDGPVRCPSTVNRVRYHPMPPGNGFRYSERHSCLLRL